MKMNRLFVGFVSFAICCLCVLTSCNNEENSKESQETREKIQNTRWKMTEIYIMPDRYSSQREWIAANRCDSLMIYELRFDDKGNYHSDDRHYSAIVGHSNAVHSGEYRVVGKTIYMRLLDTSYDAHGIYNLIINSLQNDVMEAEVGWIPNLEYYDDGTGNYSERCEFDKDNMNYLVRLKRF